MKRRHVLHSAPSAALALMAIGLGSCSTSPNASEGGLALFPTQSASVSDQVVRPHSYPRWERGVPAYQGFLGVGALDSLSLDQNGDVVDIDSDEFDSYPVLGGGGQWKFWGERADIGLELLFSASWRANAEAVSTLGGGGTVAVDVDTLLVDVFGGPFLSVFLGRSVRAYAAVGPMLQFLDYAQEDDLGNEADGSGFGVGAYARAGLEVHLQDKTWLGLGVRRTSSTVDLDDDLGEFDVDATQFVLTVTSGF